MRSIWPGNSGGVAARPALYSGYSVVRKVPPARSHATAMCVGFSLRSRLMSMATKPCTALVCWPVEVMKFSTGKA